MRYWRRASSDEMKGLFKSQLQTKRKLSDEAARSMTEPSVFGRRAQRGDVPLIFFWVPADDIKDMHRVIWVSGFVFLSEMDELAEDFRMPLTSPVKHPPHLIRMAVSPGVALEPEVLSPEE